MKLTPLKPFGIKIEDVSILEPRVLGQIQSLMLEHELVIVKKQSLKADEWVKVCSAVGNVKQYKHFTHPQHPEIILVTPEKKDGVAIGLFGKNELSWHTNGTARINPEPGLGIYGLNPGQNSVTSFANCHLAYEKLSNEKKLHFQKLKVRFKYENNRFIKSDNKEAQVLSRMGSGESEGIIKPLCITHPISKKIALYWGVHYVDKIMDVEPSLEKELQRELDEICFSPQNIYDHYWEEGDCLFADQLLTQHKRNSVQGDRLVFRSVFFYDS
ncbi:MAG: TauD/TfdA family dioxygenase [Bdellovibrionales bacterium]|nr:TauD/TfdA family dioxygenase [Bdellovibrionales bacterium]NQZ18045.1 TauD/TfdA family dioxygenase [Bdellovibrionales bacterium]